MQGLHQAGPEAAARMSPQAPRDPFQLGMLRLLGERAECPQEGLVRAIAGITPQPAVLLVVLLVRWAEQRTVPLLRQRLPVQVVGCGRTGLAGAAATAVLVDDEAAE